MKQYYTNSLLLTLEFVDSSENLKHDYSIVVVTKDGKKLLHKKAAGISKDHTTFVYNIFDVKEQIQKIIIGGEDIKINKIWDSLK
ncbi:hypothetical protein [Cellulosilyticum ruminicola]|uniref:hypothetical protein n=1 Tax=Cellulosilyticum ruminicola TaxID=425254 RepID=UPI0006CF4F82|nr:hypothetical protein [Cellulosilyticum ruminicola]